MKEIENYLAISFGTDALKDFDIIQHDEVEYSLYHISLNPKIREFVPRVSMRTYPGETTAIPRVSTAPTVLQCILGFGDIFYANAGIYGDREYDKAKLPLYHIYEMTWEQAVSPTKKYLPDIKMTDEHWLIPYSINDRIYTGNIIGTFFIYSGTFEILKDVNLHHYTYYFKINKRLQISPDIWLDKGYYCVEMRNYISGMPSYKVGKHTHITPIKEGEYLLKYNLRMTSTKKNASLK